MFESLKVGDSVYHIGNGVIAETVTKVGRKYFYTNRREFGRELKFVKTTGELVSDHRCMVVSPNKKALEDKFERDSIETQIYRFYCDDYDRAKTEKRSKISLEDLRIISEILKKPEAVSEDK